MIDEGKSAIAPEVDSVAIFQLALPDGFAVDESPIGRAQIGDRHVSLLISLKRSMAARDDALSDKMMATLRVTTDQDIVAINDDFMARERAGPSEQV